MSRMLEMTTLEASSIISQIQLWKVIQNTEGKAIDEVYIPYSTDSREFIKDVFSNKDLRGDDVGITGVQLVYDNQYPATAEKLLGCSVNLLFQNIDTLVKDRGGFRYIDLFAFDKTVSNEVVDEGRYDIFLKVGYEVNSTGGLVKKNLKRH